jgi:uncharacterized protein (UPF0332 family)
VVEQGRQEESARWIDRSRESLAAARHLADGGFHREALSRISYSMFYSARALLVSRGIDVHRRSAVIAAVGRDFVRNGLVDASLHRALIVAFDARERADYLVIDEGRDHESDIGNGLVTADEFIRVVERILGFGTTQ